MKKSLLTLLFGLCGASICVPAGAQPPEGTSPFRPRTTRATPTVLDRTIRTNTIITPFSVDMNISGLSIDATITQPTDNSFIRVLLVDADSTAYLVAESSRMLNDQDTVRLDDYCEETFSLHGIRPAYLKVIVHDATIRLDRIHTSDASTIQTFAATDRQSVRRSQVEQIVKRINQYNRAHGKLWVAGVTDRALLPFDDKCRFLGMTEDGNSYGMEYYAAGIFEMGSPTKASASQRVIQESNFVEEFDWRNRHGKNWNTSCKNQKGSGYCAAFATTAAVEAVTNLYFNRKIDFDLSEIDLVKYSGLYGPNYTDGINFLSNDMDSLMSYTHYQGIIDEASLPFVPDPNHVYPDVRPTSQECVHTSGYRPYSLESGDIMGVDPNLANGTIIDSIKNQLITKGPLVSGVWDGPGGQLRHTMALVGYGTIHAGDTIATFEMDDYSYAGHAQFDIIVPQGDDRIGQTYWVFKDSDPDYHMDGYSGYMSVLFHQYNFMDNPYYFETPITCRTYTNKDIVCEDNDGDGYYFWGIGPKPADCPAWVPDQPDGNDADHTKGPMDQYGHIANLVLSALPIVITEDTTWSTSATVPNRVHVKRGATLTIKSNINMGSYPISLEKGAGLTVDGGSLTNAEIRLFPGANIRIDHNGRIATRNASDFDLPKGATLEIIEGTID